MSTDEAYSIEALRRLARRRIPRMLFDFIDGAADDEITARWNRDDFESIELCPRMMRKASTRDLSTTVLGSKLSMPVIIAPTGGAGLFWPRGELEGAAAAASVGTAMIVSAAALERLEDVASAGKGSKWFQLFIYRDRGITEEFVQRAKAAGYDALCLTCDAQVLGNRERDYRNAFTMRPWTSPRAALDMLTHPRWLWSMTRTPKIAFRNFDGRAPANAGKLGAFMAEITDPGVTWEDFEWLRSIWDGPLVIKGLLSSADAKQAVELGANGIVVSNHGGRQLDGAPSSIAALPRIADAVEGRAELFLDSGIRRGTDVLKARALGARACLVGRAWLWGLASGGRHGVERALQIFKGEIDRAMALGGWESLDEITAADVMLRKR